MKRLLSLLLAVTLILSVNTVFVFADNASEHILFSEDFNDYTGESTLPDGWSWTAEAAEDVINDTNPVKFGYGNDTALKIKSDNHASAYTLKSSIGSIDITTGVVKLSFQVNFEHIESNASYTQTLSVYGGNTNGPYIKGLSIVNGKVRYYSGDTASGRWNASYTTAYVEAGNWYNFDVISDYDNNKTVYYMDGKPLYDQTTGKIVETAASFSGGSSPVTAATQFLIGARTKHESSSDGGDILIDNITISKGTASGVYCANGTELFENPDKLDIKFNNTVNLKDFNKDDITVNTYRAEDALMLNGTPVDFTVENISKSGCELVFSSEAVLDDYDKIKADFGNSTDMLGGKLSSVALVKMPKPAEEATEEIVYDSDNPESSLAKITMSKATVTDYPYNLNGEDRTADFYQTTTEGGNANIGFVMKDGSDIFVPGNEYNISFKMKPLETNYWSDTANILTRDFNFRGIFDTKRYEDGSLCHNEGVIRWFYMSNRYRSIGYHSGNASKVTAFGFDYKYNGNVDINSDVDAMFNANQWVDVTINYKPNTKSCSIAVEGIGTNGQPLSGGEENYPAFLSNKALSSTYAAAYPDIDTNLIDGSLRTVGFSVQANGARFMLDDFKITKKEVTENNAALKYVVLKNEDGSTVQIRDTVFDAGANKIEIHFDGAVDETIADKITLSGNSELSYSTEYDALNKVLTIDFFETLLTNGNYTISLPADMSFIGGLTSISFEVAEGEITFKAPEIKTGESTALANVSVKNTASSDNSAVLLIAAYKNGMTVDVKCADIYAEKGTLTLIESDMVSTENADTVKAFVLTKNDLIHLADYSEKEISDKSSDIKYDYNYSGNTDGEYVTAILMKPTSDNKNVSYSLEEFCDKDTVEYVDLIKADDGVWSFGFDITSASGKYTLYVMSEHGTLTNKKEIIYADEAERAEAQAKVERAVNESESSKDIEKVIEDNAIALGLYNIDLYESTDKEYIAKLLYNSLKENPIDSENTKDVYERVADICLIDALNNGSVTDISKYENDAKVFSKEPIKTWYAKNLSNPANVTSRLKNQSIADEDDLAQKLMEALALEIIDEGNGYSYVKDLCELLADKIGIDTSDATISTYRSMDGKDYADYEELKEDFEDLTDNSGSGGSDSSSGSSGSKRSNSGGVSSVLPIEQTVPAPLTEYVFDDIAEYTWAVESITNLYKNNIISGKGEKSFAPQDNVLREEFVKMIVGAFNISGTTDVKFADVSDNDWFKPYIDKAYGAGVVKGEGETFGTGKCITRQDMAKMIYEIASTKGLKLDLGDISVFTDNGDIASYALDAVSALYKSGIINGKGNGIFAPRDYATRAEAAVIISRAMNLIK